MVPARTNGQQISPSFDYHRYLASREWAAIRRQVHTRSGGTCERCLVMKGRDVHHVTYERVGHESLADLLHVCGPCHRWLSADFPVDPLDVQAWVFASCFSRFLADGPYHKDGDRDDEDQAFEDKYGPTWESLFIQFIVSWPEIASGIGGLE